VTLLLVEQYSLQFYFLDGNVKIIQENEAVEFIAESDWEKDVFGRILDRKSICKVTEGDSHTNQYPGKSRDYNLRIEFKMPEWGT
jgi:hypothetical protein